MTEKCWSCNKEITQTDLFCPHCQSIQPVYALNPFSLFGIPSLFEVDTTKLADTYFSLQRNLHPDRFMSKSEQEREYAVQQVARLNEAYRILCSPAERSEYLLKISGWELPKTTNPQLPQTMLLHQFELREALDEVSNVQGLNKLKAQVDAEIKSCIATLGEAFKNKEKEPAQCKTVELQFLQKFQSEITTRAKTLS